MTTTESKTDVRAVRIAYVGAALVWASVLLLPWWPEPYYDRYFMQYRHEVEMSRDWFTAIPASYYWFGFAIHLASVAVAPWLMALRGRWHWLTSIVLLTTLWQFIGVRGQTLMNTTVVPYLPLLGGVAIAFCWLFVRTARLPEGW